MFESKPEKQRAIYQIKKRLNNLILLMYVIFFYSDFLSKVFSKITYNFLNSSMITIKIIGTGNKNILNNNFLPNPSHIYISDFPTNYINCISKVCNFVNERTTVTMEFNENINTCENMFNGLTYITEIDLSSFNSFNVRNMNSMFKGCTSLTSIDFTNFNTQNVINMDYMFSNCKNLISLDLSHFNTKKVKSTSSMFSGCSKLSNLKLLNFDASSLTSMSNMFEYCSNLETLDLSSFITNSVNNMSKLFYGCTNLKSLDISNFDTSSVFTMEYMFYQCFQLTSLDLSSFNTQNIENMNYMFYGCQSLLQLDLSNFNTKKVRNMNNLFNGCKKLNSLDLKNFDTSLLTGMENMFSGCENLISLNLSSFNTKAVINMENMFYNCLKLEYINLSSFNTYLVSNMNNMFSGCKNLLFLNISNFNFFSASSMNGMFKDCNSLIYINLDFRNKDILSKTQTNNIFDLASINITYCIDGQYANNFTKSKKIVSQCKNICFHDSKIIVENRTCIKRCQNDAIYKYFFFWRCFEKCLYKTHISYYNDFECEQDVKCLEKNITNCPKKEGHYVDINDRIYKRCQNNCRYCFGAGDNIDNNCTECRPGFRLVNEQNKERNCYPKCNYSYYFDYKDKYHCTKNSSCPNEYKKFIPKKTKCIHRCNRDNIYQSECDNNTCCINCTNGKIILSSKKFCNDKKYIKDETLRRDIEEKEEKILDVQEKLKNGSLDNDIKNIAKLNQDIVIYENGLTIQLTKLVQKINSNNNYSSINLSECENILKNIYQINDSVTLIILKFDYFSQDSLIPMIGYEVYNPIDMSNLNLSHCNNISAKLSIPITLNLDNLFQYDPNNEFYQDKCSTFTSDNGTDMLLSDRKKMFTENKMSLCESNCSYDGYEQNSKLTKCICNIKNEMGTITDLENNPNKLSAQFSVEETKTSSSNMVSMECSKVLFTAKGLKKNISSYILLAIMFYYLFSIVAFIKCGYPSLKIDMNTIIRQKEKSSLNTINKQITGGFAYHKVNVKSKIIQKYAPPRRSGIRFLTNDKENKRYKTFLKSNINSDSAKRMNFMETYRKLKELEKNQIKNKIIKYNEKPILKIKKDKPISNVANKKEYIDYIDYELNSMMYSDAILYDHRTFCRYYLSLLKFKHPLLFGFCRVKDYNLMIIKSDIFFLSFSIYYAINFFLLTEEIIHNLFEKGGKYNILDFIEPICISFAISHIIIIIIKLIFLSERNLMELKMQPTYFEAYQITNKIKKNLVIKYVFFFLLSLIFLFIFWIFLSSFGAVFQNI